MSVRLAKEVVNGLKNIIAAATKRDVLKNTHRFNLPGLAHSEVYSAKIGFIPFFVIQQKLTIKEIKMLNRHLGFPDGFFMRYVWVL